MIAKKPFFDCPVLNVPGVPEIRINARLVIAFWDFHILTAYGQTFRTPLEKEQIQTLIKAAQ